ncbi:hypothetical protein [Actinomadura rubrisoli]|uniref:Uncharacterized protein n=1 Tax=Actinomadura rubrisoli TaxID=2530368 RepID=A0A4R5C7R9_9ACTN|nr:hypothetical protein [Actinomadura rubrisoli]TDD94789.1 hypothetical protein E1298_06375 [Actinomadura rubrisoli]
MTDWTQHHPTQKLTAPDNQMVNIDVEMVPLVTALWRLGCVTKVSCQDAGEAVREGGTRTPEADRPRVSAKLTGRAWLVVRHDDVPRLLDIWSGLGTPDDWMVRPVKKDRNPDEWRSIVFPRELISAAARAAHAAG